METLYRFCSFGSYTSLMKNGKNLSFYKIFAKTDVHVLCLPVEKLFDMKQSYQQVDDLVSETETYLEKQGLPLCDFKVYRPRATRKLLDVFRAAARRIILINKRNAHEKKGGLLRGLIFSMKERQIMDSISNMQHNQQGRVSQRFQRLIETKVLHNFTKTDILSNMDHINKQILK